MLPDNPQSLAFGGPTAKICQTRSEAANDAVRLIPGLLDLEIPEKSNFYFFTSAKSVNGLRLAAFSSSASNLELGAECEDSWVLPLAGRLRLTDGMSLMTAEGGKNAFFIPAGRPNRIEATDRSLVRIRINSDRLQQTAKTMLGTLWESGGPIESGNPREIPLNMNQISFDPIFRVLFNQIDSYSGQQHLLDYSGIDDTLYRTMAMAMAPDVFVKAAAVRDAPESVRRLQRVCDYVMSHLGDCITITELERIANLSRRSLHNAFTRAFDLSPMAWVREQRLVAAHGLLSRPGKVRSVTEAALSCGYASASLFAANYLRRFGEVPSATFSRAHR
ncbi:MAG: helix-turn-helix transcriptional regulator [Burkholderiaceae bacterium]|nr:helix-turn-helix transcriptional regulator [Burkholderiaceae bacterium]